MTTAGAPRPARTPCSSYRLQLQPGFGFDEAAAAVPYLASLGITDLYLSPIWKARAGSRHGYDVCDPNALNDELGTPEAFERLVSAIRAHELGVIVDIVPNHMAADEARNAWWRDVLRQGQRSPHAHIFDVDWYPLKRELHGKMLLPILATSYGEALESGALRAGIVDGECVVTYGDRHIPLDAGEIPEPAALNGVPGDSSSFDRLHAVLERQAYRLASWRTAAWELNYRRFFNVDHLVGVRVERADVFHDTHRLLGELIAAGVVTGVRVDHPDGLADPARYFQRLHALGEGESEVEGRARAGIYVVVEKVLVPGERLDPAWLVHGSTGYEFLNALNGVFVARARTGALVRAYTRFAGRMPAFSDTVYAAKKQVMETTFPGDADRLAAALNALSERDRRSRDITLHALRRALVETVACLRVYRTYASEHGCSEVDRRHMVDAARDAERRAPGLPGDAIAFVRDVVVEASGADLEGLRVAVRMQQFTGAVFAKAVEDTAFYRDNTLVSLNEVGADPSRPGVPLDTFHRLNAQRREQTPLAMSATGTHDTKLGEDVRARLNVLTERGRDWQACIGAWSRVNRVHRRKTANGWAPDRHDEYRFYQALVGIWPAGSGAPAAAIAEGNLVPRLTDYMIKSAREANRHTSWIRENAEYEDGLRQFVSTSLAGGGSPAFLDSVMSFADDIAAAGVVNSLAQTLVKIAAPGVPDFYQGTEWWDLHLVDPDNRRIVELEPRRSALAAIDGALAAAGADRAALAAAYLARWTDGLVKQFVIAEALRFRRRHRDLFVDGEYVPLYALGGDGALDVLAFARGQRSAWAIAVAPRLASRAVMSGRWPVGAAWGDMGVELPEPARHHALRDVFTGRVCRSSGDGVLRLADVLATFPIALLALERPGE